MTSPSLSTTSSSSPSSLTTSLTYFSALEVRVDHTGGRICGSHWAMCLGTFFTRTVRALSSSVLSPGSEVAESGCVRADTRASENVVRTGDSNVFSRPLLTSPMVQIMEVRLVNISTALALVLMVYLLASQKIL